MNASVSSRTFKVGKAVAVRLPGSFGMAEGIEVEFEQTPHGILVREKVDAAEVKRKWLALLDEIDALPGPDYIEKREPIIFRDD